MGPLKKPAKDSFHASLSTSKGLSAVRQKYRLLGHWPWSAQFPLSAFLAGALREVRPGLHQRQGFRLDIRTSGTRIPDRPQWPKAKVDPAPVGSGEVGWGDSIGVLFGT